jgi:hypothetical protein
MSTGSCPAASGFPVLRQLFFAVCNLPINLPRFFCKRDYCSNPVQAIGILPTQAYTKAVVM